PVRVDVPDAFALFPPRPNPTSHRVELTYAVVAGGEADLTIYNSAGQPVRRLVHGGTPGGTGFVIWDGRSDDGRELPTGLYFARLASGLRTATQKVVLVRS